MKVAFLVEHLDLRRGGMERSSTEFLTEMAGLGIDIHAVTQTIAPEFNAVPATVLGSGSGGRASKYRAFVQRANAFLSQGHWDVIHSVAPCLECDLYQPRSGTIREALARTIAVRRTWVTRMLRRLGARLDPKQRLLRRLEDTLFSRPSPPLFAALSNYMQRQAIEKCHLPQNLVRVVFNGVTVKLPPEAERNAARQMIRQELDLKPADLVAIFVGHNFRRKGLTCLLEAMALKETSAWQLLVVGKDSPSSYKKLAGQLGIAQRVRFLGLRRDVHNLFLASDAGILPTYYDPCARTVLEGLSLGLPYITTAFDGASDCIQNGKNGFILKSPESQSELVTALAALSVPEARQEISQNALKLRSYLSMRRHAEQIADLYREIAAN